MDTAKKCDNVWVYCLLCYTICVTNACNNNRDCSYLGKCDTTTSQCMCNNGWYGSQCDQINISSTINHSIDGYHDSTAELTWDGSPIFDPIENKYNID